MFVVTNLSQAFVTSECNMLLDFIHIFWWATEVGKITILHTFDPS